MRRRTPAPLPAQQMIRDYLVRVSAAAQKVLPKGDRLLFVGRTRATIEAQVGPIASAKADDVAAALTALGDPEELAKRERERLYSARRRGAAAQPAKLWKPEKPAKPAKPDRKAPRDAKPLPRMRRTRGSGSRLIRKYGPWPGEPETAGRAPAGDTPRDSTGRGPGPSGPAPAGAPPGGEQDAGQQAVGGPVSGGPGRGGPDTGGPPGRPEGDRPLAGGPGVAGAEGQAPRVPQAWQPDLAETQPKQTWPVIGPGTSSQPADSGSSGAGTGGQPADRSGAGTGGQPADRSGAGTAGGVRRTGGQPADGSRPGNGRPRPADSPPANGRRPADGRGPVQPGASAAWGEPPGNGTLAGRGELSGNGTLPERDGRTGDGTSAVPGQRAWDGAPAGPGERAPDSASSGPGGPAPDGPAAAPGAADGAQPVSIVPGMEPAEEDEPLGSTKLGRPEPLTEAWAFVRRQPLESVSLLLLGVGGLIYPFPIWLIGAAVSVRSQWWDKRDKWLAFTGPVLFTVAALIVMGITGQGNFFVAFGHATSHFGLLLRVGCLLTAGYLVWRLRRGPRRRRVPPWQRLR